MTQHRLAETVRRGMQVDDGILRFFSESGYAHRDPSDPANCDLVAGNPQEIAMPEFSDSIRSLAVPRDKDWFAYKFNEPYACEAAAAGLRERRGVPFDAQDVFMTDGAFSGLALTIGLVTDPGEEVIFLSPPWFFYASTIIGHGAVPVRARVDETTWDLDVDAIADAITDRTRAIIVNSPNNPTGRIYPAETLDRLGEVLTSASERNGRPIYLISDEAYSRILFDDRPYVSPTEHYRYSFLVYTYGKQLLTPGQRIGYVALPPSMPDREQLRVGVQWSQLAITGHGVPNAIMQRAVADLDPLLVDVKALQRRRDRFVDELRSYGYDLHAPEGAFYLIPTSPDPDDEAFVERLAKDKVFVLPGSIVELPGRFRISVTGSDEMVERSLPVFEAAARG
jgi:aspartate aminotransferase